LINNILFVIHYFACELFVLFTMHFEGLLYFINQIIHERTFATYFKAHINDFLYLKGKDAVTLGRELLNHFGGLRGLINIFINIVYLQFFRR